MENIINQIIAWVSANQELFQIIIIVVSLVYGQAMTAISKVDRMVIDPAIDTSGLSDEAKLDLATKNFLTLFGKKFGWVLMIPGAEALIKYIIQLIFNGLKK